MTETSFGYELEMRMEPAGCIDACGKIYGERGTDEFVCRIVGIRIWTGAVADAIGYGIAATEHSCIKKVSVELSIETYDITYAGQLSIAGMGQAGATIIGQNESGFNARIAKTSVVRGGRQAVGTISDIKGVTAETIAAYEIVAIFVAGDEFSPFKTETV